MTLMCLVVIYNTTRYELLTRLIGVIANETHVIRQYIVYNTAQIRVKYLLMVRMGN